MSTSTLLSSLFHYKAWANAELFALLSSLDEVAHKTERHSAIRILNHIYVVDRIFAAHLKKCPHGYTGTNTTETPSMEELRLAVKQSDQWYVDYLVSASPQELAEPIEFTFTDGMLGRMSREEMLVHVITHGGYHRGAVGRILAQLSISPPRDLFTGYLHKTEPGRRERGWGAGT